MSQVIGFRLDRENPREAQALAVLERWQEAGYSTRHILTEALLTLEASETDGGQEFPVEKIVSALEQVGEQLARLQREGLRPRSVEAPEALLEEAFLLSVKEAAQPGLRLDD